MCIGLGGEGEAEVEGNSRFSLGQMDLLVKTRERGQCNGECECVRVHVKVCGKAYKSVCEHERLCESERA